MRDIARGARLVRDEQFGPVIPALADDSVDEVVACANDSEHCLAARSGPAKSSAGLRSRCASTAAPRVSTNRGARMAQLARSFTRRRADLCVASFQKAIEMPEILLERVGASAIVTLNRPEAMNALSTSLRAALAAALDEAEADPAIHVIVLTGAGTRAFSAGLDLRELASDAKAMMAANATSREANPARAVESCRKPVIGAINGVAITGGFELALAADILIASTNAAFADTHGRVGVMPGWGLSQKLARIIGAGRAKRLSFTGNFIDAAQAERWGLVSEVVEPDRLLPAALALAEDMAGIEPAFLVAYKALIDDGLAASLKAGRALEHERSTKWNSAVTPEEIARRRDAVQARGRTREGGRV